MNPPFYVLSSGDESPVSTPNTSLSGSSHDTSRAQYHIEDFETFANDLNNAAKSAFPNRGRSRYETVNVCLIRWEEDELLVEPELIRLDNVLQDYGFKTNRWQIPTRNSHLDLMMKTGEFIRESDGENNLFVVYYGGHGRINSERQAEWLCRRNPNSPRVHWSAIQTLFAEAQSDVLILLDACAAASATTRSLQGSMEAIMACGFESKAPPPGEHSFTNSLINVLEDWIDRRSFSASCLHAEILSQLKLKENKKGREGVKLEWCVTPIHINCTQDPKAPSIELCRRNILPPQNTNARKNDDNLADAMDLDFDDSHSSQLSSLSSLTSSGEYRIPHVIISVALDENQPDLDVKKATRWLENIPFLAKWATVEGVFKSYSTLLILSVPVPVWNMLPDNPACSFVGYATSPNLASATWPILETEIEQKHADAVSQRKLDSSSPGLDAALKSMNISKKRTLSSHYTPLDSSHLNAQVGDLSRRTQIIHPSVTSPTSNSYGLGSSMSVSSIVHPTQYQEARSSATQVSSSANSSVQPTLPAAPGQTGVQTPSGQVSQTPAPATQSSGGTIEIFKSVYVNMEDPCYIILLAALKKYNINASWQEYALFIMYSGTERRLDSDEKPLVIFQQLHKEGKNPVFMLRKRIPAGPTQPMWGVLYARIMVDV